MTQFFKRIDQISVTGINQSNTLLYTATTPCSLYDIRWKLESYIRAPTDLETPSPAIYIYQIVREGFSPQTIVVNAPMNNPSSIIGVGTGVMFAFHNDADDEPLFNQIFKDCGHSKDVWTLGVGDRLYLSVYNPISQQPVYVCVTEMEICV